MLNLSLALELRRRSCLIDRSGRQYERGEISIGPTGHAETAPIISDRTRPLERARLSAAEISRTLTRRCGCAIGARYPTSVRHVRLPRPASPGPSVRYRWHW